jgi:CHASE3 domain sensor protein
MTAAKAWPAKAVVRLAGSFKLMLFALALTLVVCGWLVWNMVDSRQSAAKTKLEHLRLEQLRGVIIHLDEVLTMSARMAASSGDAAWEQRYRQHEPQLDRAIKEALQLADKESLGAAVRVTDEANIKLVAMENRAFALVHEGKAAEARAVLASADYEKLKAVYAGGIRDLMTHLDHRLNAARGSSQRRAGIALMFSCAAMAAILIVWLPALLRMRRWLAAPELERARAALGTSRPEPPGARQMGGMATIVAWFSMTVGALVLAGWAFDLPALKSILPGWVTVKPNTALGFVLTGIALLLMQPPPAQSAIRNPQSAILSRLCALLAGLIGLLTLGEYASGITFGIDQWLFPEPAGAVGTSHPGRMAPDTALCFVLLAAALWAARDARKTRWALPASVLFSWLVAAIGLVAMFSYLTPGLAGHGWWGFTGMAVPTAAVFVVLGAAMVMHGWRDAVGPSLTHFSNHLWRTAGMLVALVIAFALYVRSREQIDFTNELRHRSFLLADELRQSGDDLTRMVRTYVVTGDPVYKQRFQDILDIRDGKKPRPEDYARPYWDLVLKDRPAPRGSQQAIPLLELMRQAGFTEEEFGNLAEAKANSDALTIPEFEAMKLVEPVGPDAEANRIKAAKMMYDDKYHQAKAAVMGPINDFMALVDQRTLAAVVAARNTATLFRYVFVAFGLGVMFVIWRAYVALGRTLGASVDTVYAHIARLGSGDFSSPLPAKAGSGSSVLGWLSETQAKLNDIDLDRKRAETSLRAEIAERKQAVEALARRTEEMAQFNAAAVDRELRMVELKGQVNDLARQLGQPPPYDLEALEGTVPTTTSAATGQVVL